MRSIIKRILVVVVSLAFFIAPAISLAQTGSLAIGSSVVTSANLNVRIKANVQSGNILCTQPLGSSGVIASGPQTNQGYTWWNVNFNTGCDGWAVQNYLSNASDMPEVLGASTQSSSMSGNCPSAAKPQASCAGQWLPVEGANSCTIGYVCHTKGPQSCAPGFVKNDGECMPPNANIPSTLICSSAQHIHFSGDTPSCQDNTTSDEQCSLQCAAGFHPAGPANTCNQECVPNSNSGLAPTISVSQTAAANNSITISWNSQNAPADSAVFIYLVPSDNNSKTLLAGKQPTAGSYTWKETPTCADGSDICSLVIGTPGTYAILAELYTPKNACVGEGCESKQAVEPTVLTSSLSNSFTIGGSGGAHTTTTTTTSGGSGGSGNCYTGTPITVCWDASVASAPAGFTAAVSSAADYINAHFSDPVSVTINVGWGEVNGSAMCGGCVGSSWFYWSPVSYATMKSALTKDAKSVDDSTAVVNLPSTDPTGGHSMYTTIALEKALGLGSGTDGAIGLVSTDQTVALHELTEVMGREILNADYNPMGLIDFISQGNRLLNGGSGYVSIDGGNTALINAVGNGNLWAGGGSDFADWANSGDSFSGYCCGPISDGTIAGHPEENADIRVMDVLGWDLKPHVGANLTASPQSVAPGGSVTLSWTSVYATSCTGTGFTASATAGSVTVTPTQSTTYSITCTGTGGTATASQSVTVSLPGAATFLRSDTKTQGNWLGVYGTDGYYVSQDNSTKAPTYAVMNIVGNQNYTWAASTPDVRALQKPENPTDRIAGTWYSTSPYTFDIAADGATHQVALYALDWDNLGRAENIRVLDGNTGALLDTESLPAGSMANGIYLVWNMSGHVKFEVDFVGPSTANAVISGIFFGGSGNVGPVTPTVTLSASPSSIPSGNSSTLTWSSTNATSCTGEGFAASGTSGSVTVTPAQTTTYSLNCTGAGGSGSATATVAVTPPISLDGSTLVAPSTSSLVSIEGVWTYGAFFSSPNNYYLNLNGASAAGGIASKMEVCGGGHMYVVGTDSVWYLWNGSGWTSGQTPSCTNLNAPTVSLSASPTSITSGQSSTLTWSSTNATICTGTNFTATGSSGSVSVAPSQTTGYSVSCSGAGGSASATTTVTVNTPGAPTVTFSASPTSIASGGSSTLTWSSTNMTSCSGTNFTPVGISGSALVSPQQTTMYTITCTGPGGSASTSTTVTVSAPPAPTVSLAANPASITAGQSSTLSWSSTDALSCTGTGFSAPGVTGSASVTPSQTTTYAISCSGAGGSANSSVTVTVNPITPTFGLNVRVITTSTLNVRSKPNTNAGKPLCTQPAGSYGTIVGGPQNNQGYTWWNVKYDTGCDGWSVQDYLSLVTAMAPGGATYAQTAGASSGQTAAATNATSQIQSLISELQSMIARLQQ